jgi:hypothetical protein
MSDKLEGFGGETVRGVGTGKKTPIVKISEKAGTYLHGVLLAKKSYKDDDGKDRMIATFKLLSTDCTMIMKGAQGYAPVTDVKAGSEVTIYGAPTRLERALNAIEADGKNEVMIVYDGKKKEVINGRGVNAHNYRVQKKAALVAAGASDEELPD